jgi:hypothetical protein
MRGELIMNKYFVVLSNNVSNVLERKRIYYKERKYVIVTDMLYKGDIYINDYDDINMACKRLSEID